MPLTALGGEHLVLAQLTHKPCYGTTQRFSAVNRGNKYFALSRESLQNIANMLPRLQVSWDGVGVVRKHTDVCRIAKLLRKAFCWSKYLDCRYSNLVSVDKMQIIHSRNLLVSLYLGWGAIQVINCIDIIVQTAAPGCQHHAEVVKMWKVVWPAAASGWVSWSPSLSCSG